MCVFDKIVENNSCNCPLLDDRIPVINYILNSNGKSFCIFDSRELLGKLTMRKKKGMMKHIVYPIFIAIRKPGLSFSIFPYT